MEKVHITIELTDAWNSRLLNEYRLTADRLGGRIYSQSYEDFIGEFICSLLLSDSARDFFHDYLNSHPSAPFRHESNPDPQLR